MTTLLVLILMTVMLMGGLALARMTESSFLISGNVASREASIHAAEVGWNTAFTTIKAMAAENAAIGGWYFPTIQPDDANGIPAVDWSAAATVPAGVGRYTVNYVVDRQCTVANVVTASRECLVKLEPPPPAGDASEDKSATAQDYQPPTWRQFRITVRVTDQRGTQTWTQALVNR
ncbi:MAG: hypothetical protein HY855_03785 [Burkholderiales bacterium]|nr:hypothetical protein [Burkholderiales bacterium]